ncbi:MAG: hypothetical protein KAG66_18015, partial [Methylococcales bacterium]|nr:hypothetical protein [Methylococcales bacterium]
WENARAVRCDDAVTTWVTDPAQVGSGIDDVNIVRARLKDSALANNVKLKLGQVLRFTVPLEIRDTFYQGPHAGESVPTGAVAAAFSSVRSDEYHPNWYPRYYQPSPENTNSDGDRVTVARSTAQLDSESLTPLASSGNTAATLAGQQVIWKINTAIQSGLSPAPQEHNVQIINELPPEVSYNASCTLNYAGGTPAHIVNENTDRTGATSAGYTQLIWNLGTISANTAIAPRVICTDSDNFAPNGTSVVNYAEIRGDTLLNALSERNDLHTITLEQTGAIKVEKAVDDILDNPNDAQIYSIKWGNFSTAAVMSAPTIIDVFPYNGDNNANNTRTP